MAINWVEVSAVATAFGALATASAAAFTANMARRTRQAVEQTKGLVLAAEDQAGAMKTQAEAAKDQVRFAEAQVRVTEAQVRVTEASMIAMSSPVLAPAFFGGLAEERSLGQGALSVTLRGGEILDLRFTAIDTPGYVQSRVRFEQRRPDLAFVFCLRNDGLGPALIETARLIVTPRNGSRLTVAGFADNTPATGKRVLVAFRSRDGLKMSRPEHINFVDSLPSASTRIELFVQYQALATKQLRSTNVKYRYKPYIPINPFDLVGALVVESFRTVDK
jgi:hypothetical protein